MGAFKNVPGDEGKQRATDGAGHSADADNCSDGVTRKHIRNGGEEIGRPTLVGSGGDTKQADGRPLRAYMSQSENRHNAAGAEEHGGETGSGGRKTQLAERRRQPSAADAADRGHVVDKDELKPDVREIQVEFRAEVRRQPEKIEPPDGIGEKFGDG